MPNSIIENLNRLQTAKEDIADAITENGGIIEQNDGLEEYPTRITNRFTEVNDTLSILLKGPTLITKSIIQNGTYSAEDDNADGYSEVTVNVANSYNAGDEGKVVSGSALIAQTAYPTTITENGTYNTTENNSVTVNVSASGNIAYKLTGKNANGIYIIECDDYIYIFGSSIYTQGTAVSQFQYTIPNGFDVSKIGTLIGGSLKGGNYDLNLPGDGGVTVSGNNLTLSFRATSFSPNYGIWTLAMITKAV